MFQLVVWLLLRNITGIYGVFCVQVSVCKTGVSEFQFANLGPKWILARTATSVPEATKSDMTPVRWKPRNA